MRSVKKIGQITKAMERVAASKMRRAQEAVLNARPYAASAREILEHLAALAGPEAHVLLAQRPIQRRLFIVFSSDRGLAGAYNSNIQRVLIKAVREAEKDAHIPRLIAVGRKGAQFCATLERGKTIEVLGVYEGWPDEPMYVDIRPIIGTALEQFVSGEVDAVSVISTDYISGLRQMAVFQQLLPLTAEAPVNTDATPKEKAEAHHVEEVLFEPEPAAVLDATLPRLVGAWLYHASLEAAASEQAMRMTAMKNASDNSRDMLDDLSLTYNGARQAAITQELAEISAGVEAMR